jgi:hypothetical protein
MITCEHCGSAACVVHSDAFCRHTNRSRTADAAVPAPSTTKKTPKGK